MYKFGPRLLVMLGGVLAGLGWVASGRAESLTALYTPLPASLAPKALAKARALH